MAPYGMTDSSGNGGGDGMDAKDICDRFAGLENRQSYWREHWQDCLDYVLPVRAPVTRHAIAGEKRASKQFDATATRYMRRLAATLTGMMASPGDRWFALRAVGVQSRAVEAWLEGTAEQLYDALHASNFYSEMPEALADLITIGTCDLYVDERPIVRPGFNGFRFTTVTPGEFFIDEDDAGQVDTVYRLVRFTARQAKLRFGEDRLPDAIRDALRPNGGGDALQEFDFIHAVYRNDRPRRASRAADGMDWRSVYVAKQDEKIVAEGGFRDQRHFVARWSKASGEMYGRGPVMEALADIKTLNTMVRYGLEGLALDVYPPWLFPDESIVGRLRMTPGAPNFYDPDVAGEIKSLRGGGNFQVELAKEQELRQQIAQTFLDDVLASRQEGDVTATEVLDRRERRQQITGPAVARIETELLDPLVTTTWKMMLRAGAFGRPPMELMNARTIEIDYISPLARAQKLASARMLQDAFALIGPLLQLAPNMVEHWDFDTIARDVPTDIGVPRKWLIDPQAVAQGRAIRARQAQAQQQLAQGAALAQAAADTSETNAKAAQAAATARATLAA